MKWIYYVLPVAKTFFSRPFIHFDVGKKIKVSNNIDNKRST